MRSIPVRESRVIILLHNESSFAIGPLTEVVLNVQEIEYGDEWVHLYKGNGKVSFPTYNVLKVEEIENERD